MNKSQSSSLCYILSTKKNCFLSPHFLLFLPFIFFFSYLSFSSFPTFHFLLFLPFSFIFLLFFPSLIPSIFLFFERTSFPSSHDSLSYPHFSSSSTIFAIQRLETALREEWKKRRKGEEKKRRREEKEKAREVIDHSTWLKVETSEEKK